MKKILLNALLFTAIANLSAQTASDNAEVKVQNTNAKFTISMAKAQGENGAMQANDVVMQPQGDVKNVFFNLNKGTLNSSRFRFGDAENNKTLVVANGGKVGINTEVFPKNDPNFNFYVKGGIKSEQVKVQLCNGWCDYVFDKTYKLKTLPEVENFVIQNKHLPNMPSAEKLYKEDGFEVGNMITMQQEKIEEIFLHLIELDKQVKALKAENEQLKKQLTEKN
jgi:hypothetical protein